MISRTNDQPAFLKIDSTSTHIRYVVDDKSDAAQRLNRNTKIGPVRTNHRLPPPCSPSQPIDLWIQLRVYWLFPTRARAGQRFWLPSSIFSYGSDIDQNSGMNAYFLQYQCSTWSLSHLFFPFSRQYRRITLNRLSLAFFLFSVMNLCRTSNHAVLLYSGWFGKQLRLGRKCCSRAMVPQQDIAWLTSKLARIQGTIMHQHSHWQDGKFCTTVFNFVKTTYHFLLNLDVRWAFSAGSSTSAHCWFWTD